MCAAPMGILPPGSRQAGGDVLGAWAEGLAGRRPAVRGRGCLRFVFYGRVSTEDWQDPVSSRARQLQQAVMLTGGHGIIVAGFFDVGESRELPWARRPQAAALVAQLADPERGWDAIVIGEYERAFYGSQFASMAPLFEHYGITLWMPEVGGPTAHGFFMCPRGDLNTHPRAISPNRGYSPNESNKNRGDYGGVPRRFG
jgi:site-specific DNA recombinase